ncbi:MAG TPA: hypothetical protein DCY13_00540 [Verrucomicrobiales bacterium]|nr:hypothetical protein [Verrucomicrobiales bacterium]
MSRWYANLGFNDNLLVQLSGGRARHQLDVYVVARFRFFHSPGAAQWTTEQASRWVRRFSELVYRTWSERWTLLSDISCNPIDLERAGTTLPTARVRVHAVDVESPSVTVPPRQRIYAIKVYRRAPDEGRARQHADALGRSAATASDAEDEELPRGTSEAELYEDSLELGDPSGEDGNRQVTAMHEFGHMLGLMHPNDMETGCIQDRSAPICYGQAYSPESGSIMGRGQTVRRDDYQVFLQIISRLVRNAPASGWFSSPHRLHWFVEGSRSTWCDGAYARLGPGRGDRTEGRGAEYAARAPGPEGIGGATRHAHPAAPVGTA